MIKRILSLLAKPLSPSQKLKLWRHIMCYRFQLHTKIGEYPSILFKIYSIFNLYAEYAVNRECSLVIDAFPRSGSTFALYAFHLAQKEHPVKVAFHLHVPAHIIRACELNIPTLVIIRNPKEAVRSAVVREPHLSVRAYLLRYRSFYKKLASYRDQFVLSQFDEVLTQFDDVIQKLNLKYATSFQHFEYTEDNIEQITHQLHLRHQQMGGDERQSYLPNSKKEIAKRSIDFKGNEELLEQCEEIYNRYAQSIDCYPPIITNT